MSIYQPTYQLLVAAPYQPSSILVREPTDEDRRRQLKLQAEAVKQRHEIRRLERKIEIYKKRRESKEDSND